ncbi:unnamed protein product [Dovyalis caffra]|uniref:squalene monooxygenase n=1 Tax=Dovyalis caffra TaxID=77055 RepID=A0AAV1R9P5_9ROSI|nr:unnamed protein product [Dovyalis caffra]
MSSLRQSNCLDILAAGAASPHISRGRKKIKASGKILSNKTLKSSRNSSSNFAGSTDVIIVGAGVAGSALAYALAKDGWRVHVIERDLTEPDRIVGELLHAGGCIKLAELGLEDCLDGIDSQTVSSFTAVHKGGKRTAISYPSTVSGRGFHNGRFIQKMREKAASLSKYSRFPLNPIGTNVKLEQGTVTSLVEENGTIKGVLYKTKTGQELAASAPLTILCDGCFSNMRHFLSNPKIEVPSYFVGLVLENYDLPYANLAFFILKDTPVVTYPIGSNEIRCLVDVSGPKIPSISNGEMANYLKTVVAPQIPLELYNAFICAIDKGNIRTMPNRIMPASPYPTPGAFLIGDSLNMRHAVTGGGMTVVLSDVVLLRDLLRPLNDLSDAAATCKYLECFYILRKPTAVAINTLAGVLHTVFSSSDQDESRKEMKQAFFNYLSLGGVFSDGLMALLSGLNPNPLSLVFHCFGMLVYAVGRLLLPFPSPKRLWNGARLISVGLGIVFPILKSEGIRATFFPVTVPAYYRTPPVQFTDDMETRQFIRLEQGTVTSLLEENGTIKGVQYKTQTGQELAASAPLTIVEIPSCFVGLVLENCLLPRANHGHFILNDTPIVFYPINDNEIRCLVDVPGHKVPSISSGEMADYLKTVVAPQTPIELYDACICAIDKGDIRTMPNRIMPVSPCPIPGTFLIRDALNMRRHSLAGGGMTLALSDTVLLRDLLRPLNDLRDAAALYKYLESFYILRKLHAVYTIYSPTKDPARKEMKQACFNYFCLGGVFSNGLMALVAGLNPNPLSLTFHCFAFAVYAVARVLLSFPSPKRMWIGAKWILGALGFLLPVMKAEGTRATFFPVTMPAYYRTPPRRSIDDFETRKL